MSFLFFLRFFTCLHILKTDEANLRHAIHETGECFLAVAKMYDQQSALLWSPFLAAMRDYANTLPAYAAMLNNQKVLLYMIISGQLVEQ